MSDWTYYDFYFGNANWPSGYLWRIDGETRQLLIEYPVYLGSVEQAVLAYHTWATDSGLVGYEAVYHVEDNGKVRVQWWSDLGDSNESEWEFSKRAGMGPTVSAECPYTRLDREWKPLPLNCTGRVYNRLKKSFDR